MKALLPAVVLATLIAVPSTAHETILHVDTHGSRLLDGHLAANGHAHDGGHGHHHHDDVVDLSGFTDCTTCPVERAAVLTLAGDIQAFERPDALPGAGATDAAVTVLVAWPARARTRDGVVALADADAGGVLTSWRTRAAITHLRAWPDAWPALFGEGLELQLLDDPATATGGSTLQARVLRDGLPIAGVAVTCNGEQAGVTDDKGRIDFQPGARGLQHLAATLRVDDPDDRIDELRLHAVLTFTRE